MLLTTDTITAPIFDPPSPFGVWRGVASLFLG